jgi:hypothetical protein
MATMARMLLGYLDAATPGQRVEVALDEDRHGRATVELCEQHHGAGVGWFDQRRISIDARQWEQLSAMLQLGGAARVLESAASEPPVLAFPGPRATPTRRLARGAV